MLPILALLTVQILFGLNYVASKIILSEFPPLLWGAIRMCTAALLMFPFTFVVVPKKQRIISTQFLGPVLLFSVFAIALNQGFFLLGLKYTTTANSSILNTLAPVFTLVIAVLIGQEKFTPLRAMGVVVAFCGVVVLRKFEDFSLQSSTLKGDVYTLLNCLSLAIFFIISKDFLRRHSVLWVTAWMFLFGAIMLGLCSFGDWAAIHQVHLSTGLIQAMIYNIVAATIVTYYLNSWALVRVHSSMVALFIYLQPVVAVLFSWFVLSDPPTVRMFAAISFIFCGVLMGFAHKKKRFI